MAIRYLLSPSNKRNQEWQYNEYVRLRWIVPPNIWSVSNDLLLLFALIEGGLLVTQWIDYTVFYSIDKKSQMTVISKDDSHISRNIRAN